MGVVVVTIDVVFYFTSIIIFIGRSKNRNNCIKMILIISIIVIS
jgi:hypothetical protein